MEDSIKHFQDDVYYQIDQYGYYNDDVCFLRFSDY